MKDRSNEYGKQHSEEEVELKDDKERDNERGAPMAPSQNRTPSEQHRGGPLPNQKK